MSDLFPYSHPEEKIGYLLWQSSMRWQREANAALSGLGLTQTQFAILAAAAWLLTEKKLVTQNEIAEYARIDKMMTSRLIAKLESEGLLKRVSGVDKRERQVSVTTKGKTLLKEAFTVIQVSDTVFMSNLSRSEKIELSQILWKLL
jgi:DNA-binding MarR family transcriptional regulator